MTSSIAYFDANALVKRYSVEAGTPIINEVFRLVPRHHCACFILGLTEVLWVLLRKKNDGRIDHRLFEKGTVAFNAEFARNDRVQVFSVDDSMVWASARFIMRHSLNPMDALLLHSVLQAKEHYRQQSRNLLFLTSDKRLLRAMGAEGITTLDPETDSLEKLHRLLGVSEPLI